MKKHFFSLLLAVLGLWGCTNTPTGTKTNEDDIQMQGVVKNDTSDSKIEHAEKVVNVYTHRHYDADKALFKEFEQKTGIEVNVVEAGADQLIARLRSEGESSPADVLITVDAGRLYRAKDQKLLQSVQSDVLNQNIPAQFRDSEGFWYGLTKRARVIAYAKDKVKPEELSTYEALADGKWKGKVLCRSSENIYNQSLMASIIQHNGDKAAKNWAVGMVKNFARNPKGEDKDQILGVASGIASVSIINTYYMGKLLNSKNESERNAVKKVALFFPNQAGRGTHINISGAGVTAYAPHKYNAIKFIEFLSNKESQEYIAKSNYEYPVNPIAKPSELLKSWGTFKEDTLNLQFLGKLNNEAVKVFDEAGWK